MWWMLLKLMGLRYAAIAKRYAGFEWMLKMLVDGVKGQAVQHTQPIFCRRAELASCKTLAIFDFDPPRN